MQPVAYRDQRPDLVQRTLLLGACTLQDVAALAVTLCAQLSGPVLELTDKNEILSSASLSSRAGRLSRHADYEFLRIDVEMCGCVRVCDNSEDIKTTKSMAIHVKDVVSTS